MAEKVRYIVFYLLSNRKAPYGFRLRRDAVSYLEEHGFVHVRLKYFSLFWQKSTGRLAEIIRKPPKKGA
jgi:hypothetical protein